MAEFTRDVQVNIPPLPLKVALVKQYLIQKARPHCWQSDATSAVREWSRRGQGIPQAGREYECPRATRIHRQYCQGLVLR